MNAETSTETAQERAVQDAAWTLVHRLIASDPTGRIQDRAEAWLSAWINN